VWLAWDHAIANRNNRKGSDTKFGAICYVSRVCDKGILEIISMSLIKWIKDK
jgi:hypothetical protein